MWSSSFLVAPNLVLLSNPKHHHTAAVAQPNRRRSVTALQNDGGVSPAQLGFTTLQSEGSQMSGSDVLRALQRASERKKKKNMMKKKKMKMKSEEELSTVCSRREDIDGHVDFHNVRPLCVKTEWGDQLDYLENHLRELSEIK